MANKSELGYPPCYFTSDICNTSNKECRDRRAPPAFHNFHQYLCPRGARCGDNPQVPIAYFRASIVNGGSTMRISAADQAIEAAMADVELLFARSFASSADAYAAMASELVGGRTVEAAATGKRGKKVHASGETPNRAAVEESIIAGVNFIKAAQIAAVKADAALVTAMNETDQAVRAAVGVSGSLHAAWLKTPPRAENSSSVAGLLYDFTVAKAALKGSKKSNQVVKQGVAAWEKAQDARQRIRKLSAHVRHVFAAVRYAENELKMVRHPERRGMSRLLEAAFALNCLSEAVEGAIACSKGAVDGSALKGPRE